MHDLQVITLLAGALGVALALGALTRRLGLSTLVGYLLAGVMVGPHTPGFVADAHLASQMAEIGVILLMFGVGLHFHPDALLAVRRIAIPGAVVQTGVAAVAGWALARAAGWGDAGGAVFGMALGVASTVVLMKMLVERGRLAEPDGHVAVGWLVVEDLFTVAVLVVLPVLAAQGASAGASSLALSLATAFAKVAAFGLVVWLAGTRLVNRLLERVARTRSRELFTLAVFVVALGIAVLASEVFAVSVALGAFFAGLVVGQSRFGPQAAADMAPFRDVFAALFFVSIGMLFDPAFVLREPALVAGVAGIVLVVKPLTAFVLVRAMRDSRRTAATVAVGLAQIGEFSFILGSLATGLGLLPADAMAALVAGAIVSIALNPVLFGAADALLARRAGPEPPPDPARLAPSAHPEVVVAGQGPVARRVALAFAERGMRVALVEPDLAGAPPADGGAVLQVCGDPARDEVLEAAGLPRARTLVLIGLGLATTMRLCTAARRLRPDLEIVAAASSPAEAAWLGEFGATQVCDALAGQVDALVRAVRP